MLQKFKRIAVSWELRRAKRFLFRGEQRLAERNFYIDHPQRPGQHN